ncbi:MAG: thiamine phosphate synthase [SAR202 cluster bacterium]|jgi:thiamine-phosphate pyrophosphorylase|nr:thiamine phosphate synthase [SAR202 cluster bacterium]|tara:strand:- start:557 stop:1219 length:663 start_codon:yes stop_codon:yes gene_type:complete
MKDSNVTKNIVNRVKGLYVILDPEIMKDSSIIELAKATLSGGTTAIQLRDKQNDKGIQLKIAIELRKLCEEYNAALIINDHADLAVASDSHGLHIGQNDLPYSYSKKILKPSQFIGTSNNNIEESKLSINNGADYIAIGAMFTTDSKSNTRPSSLSYLTEIKQLSPLPPVVAIGGININNIDLVLEAGADSICVISAVSLSDDPEKSTKSLVDKIQNFSN